MQNKTLGKRLSEKPFPLYPNYSKSIVGKQQEMLYELLLQEDQKTELALQFGELSSKTR